MVSFCKKFIDSAHHVLYQSYTDKAWLLLGTDLWESEKRGDGPDHTIGCYFVAHYCTQPAL